MIRKLLTTLLFVPFLSGVNVRTAAPVNAAPAAYTDAISSASARLVEPALPGVAALSSLFDAGPGSSWRTPTRSHSGDADPVGSNGSAHTTRVRASTLHRDYLQYARTLDQARINVPTTYGNPPPSSLT